MLGTIFGIALLIYALLHTLTTVAAAFGFDEKIAEEDLSTVIPLRLVFAAFLWWGALSLIT